MGGRPRKTQNTQAESQTKAKKSSPSPSPSPSPSTSKTVHGELGMVLLSHDEYQKLISKHGEHRTKEAIEILDGYIAQQKKDPYANHYAVLKDGSWVWSRLDERVSVNHAARKTLPQFHPDMVKG